MNEHNINELEDMINEEQKKITLLSSECSDIDAIEEEQDFEYKDACVWYKSTSIENQNPHRLKCNYGCDGFNTGCVYYKGTYDTMKKYNIKKI